MLLPVENKLLRYSCQMALPGFNKAVQQLLESSRVLIIGAGGLGCPAAQYLAATGIGTLGIADFDVVSASNLHRQILYSQEEIGLKKVIIACKKLQQQNPFIKLHTHDLTVASDNVMQLIKQYNIVVDATDNFETKYLINDACFLLNKPLVYGAIYQYEGQVAVWNVINADGTKTPNYRDVFPEVNAAQIPDCAEGGVLPTVAGIIGCMQANEVIKLITNQGEVLAGKMLLLNALTLQSRIIQIGTQTKTTITALQATQLIPKITVAALQNGMKENVYELVDVRNEEEHAAFNIGGKHIPVSEINHTYIQFSDDTPVVFYCASGKRSEEVVKQLLNKNPNLKVYSLEGGIKAWLSHT